jgi:hypothetical protein
LKFLGYCCQGRFGLVFAVDRSEQAKKLFQPTSSFFHVRKHDGNWQSLAIFTGVPDAQDINVACLKLIAHFNCISVEPATVLQFPGWWPMLARLNGR